MSPLVNAWLADVKDSNASAETLRSYRNKISRFAEWLDGDLLAVTRDDARRYRVELDERGYLANTVRQHLMTLKLFYDWLVDQDDIDVNPWAKIKRPAPPQVITKVLDADQVRALLATCDKSILGIRDRAIISVMVDTGMRAAEVCGLEVSDVSVEQSCVIVRNGKGKARQGARMRVVPVSTATLLDLDRYNRVRVRQMPTGDALWLNRMGKPLTVTGLRLMLRRRAERVGIDRLHPHVLRHTFASEFRLAGGQEGDLMVLAGWSSRSMLDRYGKITAEQRAIAAGRKLAYRDRLRRA